MSKTIDLTIIGAGPAGISTALHLIHLDSTWAERMLVLEKARHPRHKVCGGGITRYGLDQLLDLGLKLEIPFVPINIANINYKQHSLNFRGKPIFAVWYRGWLKCSRRGELQVLFTAR